MKFVLAFLVLLPLTACFSNGFGASGNGGSFNPGCASADIYPMTEKAL